MRPEARFSDGSPLTAEDVVFTFDMMKTKGQLRYRAYFGDIEKVEALGPHEVKFTFRQGAPVRDLLQTVAITCDLLQGLLRGARLLPRLHGPAARLRPLPGGPGRRRPHRRLPPRPGLLGQGPAGQRRRQQLRRDPHRLLRRPGQRLRGLQSRRIHLPRRDQRRPLADRLRLPGEAARRRRHRRDPRPHRPLRRRRLLQPAPRGLAGPARPAGDRDHVQLRVDQRHPLPRRRAPRPELLGAQRHGRRGPDARRRAGGARAAPRRPPRGHRRHPRPTPPPSPTRARAASATAPASARRSQLLKDAGYRQEGGQLIGPKASSASRSCTRAPTPSSISRPSSRSCAASASTPRSASSTAPSGASGPRPSTSTPSSSTCR